MDFFAPFLDDPYVYGGIAAANAMNDVYAMGGEVLFALNVAGFPEDLPTEMVAQILAGGADKVREAGGVVAGGHTVIDHEPKYGLCVTGLVHPDRVRTNTGARTGDALVLTKRLGTGVLINAIQQEVASPAHAEAAIAQMLQLNAAAARATHDLDVHAMTDVTGFGLGGAPDRNRAGKQGAGAGADRKCAAHRRLPRVCTPWFDNPGATRQSRALRSGSDG